MSVDPMTGRNPSYCFVDLISKDLAEGVMEMYNGRMFRQRPLVSHLTISITSTLFSVQHFQISSRV